MRVTTFAQCGLDRASTAPHEGAQHPDLLLDTVLLEVFSFVLRHICEYTTGTRHHHPDSNERQQDVRKTSFPLFDDELFTHSSPPIDLLAAVHTTHQKYVALFFAPLLICERYRSLC